MRVNLPANPACLSQLSDILGIYCNLEGGERFTWGGVGGLFLLQLQVPGALPK